MTSWWSFNSLKQKLGRFQFLIILAILLAATGYLGFRLGGQVEVWQQDKMVELESRLVTLYDELDNKIRQINYLSVELEVEKNASEQVQEEILALREETFALRRELNFYQKVVAPELIAEGISVEQLNVEPTNITNRYKFRFVLVQTDAKKRNAKGYIRLKLIGSNGERKVSMDLAKLAEMGKDDLKFSFNYFQYFEGEFELAEGTIAEELEVKVIRPKTKWQPYKATTQTLPWPEFKQDS